MKWMLIILLLILTACTTGNAVKDINETELPDCKEIICNSPYIRFEYSCCLDTDSNSICDDDEVKEKNNKVTLNDVAKLFAEYRENHDYDKIYDLLIEEKRDYIDQYDFISLFPGIEFGFDNVILGTEVERRVADDPIDEINVKKVYTNNSVVYEVELTTGGTIEKQYDFVIENDEWKLDAYDYIIYRSCYAVIDCNDFSFECEVTCKDSFSELSDEDSFLCRDDLCHCKCIDKNGYGRFFVPDVE